VAKDISKWNAFQAAAKIEETHESDPSSLVITRSFIVPLTA